MIALKTYKMVDAIIAISNSNVNINQPDANK